MKTGSGFVCEIRGNFLLIFKLIDKHLSLKCLSIKRTKNLKSPTLQKKKLKSNLKTFCLEQKKNLENEKGLFFSYEQKKAES